MDKQEELKKLVEDVSKRRKILFALQKDAQRLEKEKNNIIKEIKETREMFDKIKEDNKGFIAEHGVVVANLSAVKKELRSAVTEHGKVVGDKKSELCECLKEIEILDKKKNENQVKEAELKKRESKLSKGMSELEEKKSEHLKRIDDLMYKMNIYWSDTKKLKQRETGLTIRENSLSDKVESINKTKESLSSKELKLSERERVIEEMEVTLKLLIGDNKGKSDILDKMTLEVQNEKNNVKALQISFERQVGELEGRRNEIEVKRLRVEKLIKDKRLTNDIKKLEEELD